MKSSVILLLSAVVLADYTGNDEVVVLTDANFQSTVIESDELWMVEFYAPWCGHCKNLEPNWKKAAKQTAGIAKFGAVDATVHSALGSKYGVKGYPTIKVFGANKKKPEEYQGGRSAADLKKYAIKQAQKLDPSKGGAADDEPEPEERHDYGADVVILNDDNFDKVVKESGKVAFVKFMAPWCGHCKSMVGDLSKAATILKGEAIVGAVDATKYAALAGRFDVKGFPTLVVFYPDGRHEEYSGSREGAQIAEYISSKAAEFGEPPVVPQVTSTEQFDEACRGSGKALCVVVMLPHVADGGAARRNKLLTMLNALSGKHRKHAFVWTSAGEQNALADALGFTVYPAAAAVNFKKGVFGKFALAFDDAHLGKWLGRAISASAKLPAEPVKIKTVAAWDGQDYVAPKEEED